MNTEKYILDDARQWFIVRKAKHAEDYETTYYHLHHELMANLDRVRNPVIELEQRQGEI